jgi:ComF family protein
VIAAPGRTLAGAVLDLFLPPRCTLCGTVIEARLQPVCPLCLESFEKVADPVCVLCGQPVARPGPCADCRAAPPGPVRIRAPLLFGGGAQQAVLALKRNRKVRLAPWLASWILADAPDGPAFATRDLLVPVPLHPRRLRQRGFNQAALIAIALAKETGVEVALEHLVRRRATRPQSEMSGRAERLRNVRDAFRVVPRRRAPIAGKRICLVDDVATTGATLGACARALRQAGACSVVALCVARTARV